MSQITVRIPAPLRSFTSGQSEVSARGTDVGAVLADLQLRNRQLAERILDGDGGPRPFVNLFVDNRNIRDLGGLETPLDDGAVLYVIPAVAGGA